MKYYELTYLISPSLGEEEAKEIQRKLTSLIQEQGGILESSAGKENPQKTNLSYPIKKEVEAYLASQTFYLEPAKLKLLKNEVNSEKNIMRSLIFSKKKEKKVKPHRRTKTKEKEKTEKKVALKEIDKKLDEILGE